MTKNPCVGIIGFGFSGLMVTANLLREATQPLTIYIIDPLLNVRGAAYVTDQPSHLLNVQAQRMGAWKDMPDDFFRWLKSDAGKYACTAKKLPIYTDGAAYVPRLIYGEYLQSIWNETQEIAAQKNCTIKLVPSEAVALRNDVHALAILTARGDAIAVQHAVLAIGNEAKMLYPHLPLERAIQRPWDAGALAQCALTATSIAIIGTGLTTVDALLSLRALGYTGPITAFSHHGQLPCAHATTPLTDFAFDRADLLHHSKSLADLLHNVRAHLRSHKGDWREVIDAVRPHAHAIWRRLDTPNKNRFFRKLAHRWGIYRHRMAASISTLIDAEIAAQQFSLVAAQQLRAIEVSNQIVLHWRHAREEHHQTFDTVINCTGIALDVRSSKRPLIIQLLSNGFIELHPTYVGIAVDVRYRVMGEAHARLYAIGGLLTGALLESIAVPELREQAYAIASDILKSAS